MLSVSLSTVTKFVVPPETDIYTQLNGNFNPVLIKTNRIILANAEQQQHSATACAM